MLVKHLSHSHENILHIHDFGGRAPIGWPTFNAVTWALNPPYLYSLFRTVKAARERQFRRHQQWAVFHTMVAYMISIERLVLVVSYGLGWMASMLPNEPVHRFFLTENTLLEKAALELDMLALINSAAFLLAVGWITYEWRRAGLTSWIRGYSYATKQVKKSL